MSWVSIRETVARQLRAESASAKAAAGSSKPAKAPPGPRSLCGPFLETIQARLEQRFSAQRIFQDLVWEHGFSGKYHSVRRFVAKLNKSTPLPFRRIEVAAGEEAQVDFGTGSPIIDGNGRRRKTHVLRVALFNTTKLGGVEIYRMD